MYVTVLSAQVNHKHPDSTMCGNLYKVSHSLAMRGWNSRWSGDCCAAPCICGNFSGTPLTCVARYQFCRRIQNGSEHRLFSTV